MNIEKLQDELNFGWRSFLQNNGAIAFAGKPEGEIDDKLREDLSVSHYFSEKSKFVSPNDKRRNQEWAQARRLELKMEALVQNPEKNLLLTSISHTQNIVVAVGCISYLDKHRKISGVGVDIENKNRSISSEAAQRFLEPVQNLKPIDLWVLKEAAYKATPRDLQLVVSQYRLDNWDERKSEGVMVSKNVKCPVKLFTFGEFNIGLSYFGS